MQITTAFILGMGLSKLSHTVHTVYFIDQQLDYSSVVIKWKWDQRMTEDSEVRAAP